MMIRTDLNIIQQWIHPKSRILDLGCGDGELPRQKAFGGMGWKLMLIKLRPVLPGASM